MSATTVRSMLAFILENGLQMDDEIHFKLSDETDNILDTYYEIDFVSTESFTVQGSPVKHGVLVFDLHSITDA